MHVVIPSVCVHKFVFVRSLFLCSYINFACLIVRAFAVIFPYFFSLAVYFSFSFQCVVCSNVLIHFFLFLHFKLYVCSFILYWLLLCTEYSFLLILFQFIFFHTRNQPAHTYTHSEHTHTHISSARTQLKFNCLTRKKQNPAIG